MPTCFGLVAKGVANKIVALYSEIVALCPCDRARCSTTKSQIAIRLFDGRMEVARAKTMERERLQVLYSGHVQGVGFRYTVKSLVPGFEVTGTVRNLPDGRVELVAEGAKDELRAFQQAIRDSGVGGLITHEQTSWSEARNQFRGFTIVG